MNTEARTYEEILAMLPAEVIEDFIKVSLIMPVYKLPILKCLCREL